MEKCEECREYKFSAHYRPDLRRVLCAGCYGEALRRISPTQVVRRLAREAAR